MGNTFNVISVIAVNQSLQLPDSHSINNIHFI